MTSADRIEFQAYADDYIVRGELAMDAERLSTFLEDADELDVEQVTVRALEDGREHELPSAVIARDELCVVVATGPRGKTERRLRTRAYPMRADVGRYMVIGWLHALPTADPLGSGMRRKVVALSPARVEYMIAGERIEEEHDALLLMRTKVVSFERASDDDVGLAKALEAGESLDPQAKDMTGDIRHGSDE